MAQLEASPVYLSVLLPSFGTAHDICNGLSRIWNETYAPGPTHLLGGRISNKVFLMSQRLRLNIAQALEVLHHWIPQLFNSLAVCDEEEKYRSKS